MLSCFAKLVPCRDIMICPKSHSEMKTGIRSSLDNYCSYLRLTGFLSVLPRGQEAFFFIKQKQMCLSKYCEILESSFVVYTGRSGTVSLDQQQHQSVPGFGRVFDWGDLVLLLWKQINPEPGTGSLASIDSSRRISGAFPVEIPLPAQGDRWKSRQGREINPLVKIRSTQGWSRIWFVMVFSSTESSFVRMSPLQPWEQHAAHTPSQKKPSALFVCLYHSLVARTYPW